MRAVLNIMPTSITELLHTPNLEPTIDITVHAMGYLLAVGRQGFKTLDIIHLEYRDLSATLQDKLDVEGQEHDMGIIFDLSPEVDIKRRAQLEQWKTMSAFNSSSPRTHLDFHQTRLLIWSKSYLY